MAYNFKSIADVEVVAEPTESANVLIEEDGVIKKAPKTTIGGINNNSSDSPVFICIFSRMETDWECDKSYDEVLEAYESGKLVMALAENTRYIACAFYDSKDDPYIVFGSFSTTEYTGILQLHKDGYAW